MSEAPLIEIKGLEVHFVSSRGLINRQVRRVRAIDGVDLTIYPHETLGVVGESGCGKTTLGRAVIRLERATAGKVLFEGVDILRLSPVEMRKCRRDMQIVYQNPYSSFDPRFNVLSVVAEPLVTHSRLRGRELESRAVQVLHEVGMPGEILYRYPHEFSGGQLQRLAVARALALNPKFIVLDEPTSALDVSVQAQIINLLQELQARLSLTYLFITHDLSVIQHISDRIAVMYLGKVVEMSSTEAIFNDARHPYTQALLGSAPMVEPVRRRERVILKGNVPNPANPPSGCPFHPRCPVAIETCSHVAPPLIDNGRAHLAACHLATAEKDN
jgi:oligopeptide transport system ATP-binding protein